MVESQSLQKRPLVHKDEGKKFTKKTKLDPKLFYLKVTLPPLGSDTPVLKDLMQYATSFNVSSYNRTITVGYEESKFKEAKKKLMETEYESQKLEVLEYSKEYDPLKRLLLLPKDFFDTEAVKMHYNASEVEFFKRPYTDSKSNMFVLTFKTKEEAELAMKKEFQYVQYLYNLEYIYHHINETLEKLRAAKARHIEKLKENKAKQAKKHGK